MMPCSGRGGRFSNNDYHGSASQCWYQRSIWQNHGEGYGMNGSTNMWGVSKPQRDKYDYQFSYHRPNGFQGGNSAGQINCGSQCVCSATWNNDGNSNWPVANANDLPNAFNMIVQMCQSYFEYFEKTHDQMHKHTSQLAQQVAHTQ